MRITKENLTRHLAAVDHAVSLPLRGIFFTAEGSFSADGFRLLCVPYPEPLGDTGLPRTLTDWMPGTGEGVIVSAVECARIGASIPDFGAEVTLAPVGDEVWIDVAHQDGGAHHRVRPITGAWPKWRKIVPAGNPVARLFVTAGMLRAVLDQLAPDGDGMLGIVAIETFADRLPARISRRDGETLVWALAMPTEVREPKGMHLPAGEAVGGGAR